MVYLSDSGGHGNVWVAKVDGSSTRQITFERDPAVVIGIPVWSPAGDRIVMIQSRRGNKRRVADQSRWQRTARAGAARCGRGLVPRWPVALLLHAAVGEPAIELHREDPRQRRRRRPPAMRGGEHGGRLPRFDDLLLHVA